MRKVLFYVFIRFVGETISGKTVKLVASNDVSLQAATNTSETLENAKSKGWSVGANISVAGGGILGFDASANAAKQKSNTKVTTHTGTTIVGSDAVTITSGKDTHISGSKVIGKSVTADVGGNLSIESLQDTKTYVGESSNKGFSVSTNAGSLSNVSMSSSKGKMKSDYASVTDQAGIYAGDGGFVINTAETTSLTGAVIDSTADTNKNKLSTKSLDVKDVENTAEYTSRNVGMSYNHVGNFKNLSKAGKDAVWNTLGTLPNLLPDSSKSSSSTTKSAISNGTIEVRDANFNMQTLSRDTKDSLNKLDEIFDKKKIEERQELSKLFAKEAFGQLHNWNPTSKEGKAAKAIAHGVVAEVSARMAGNKPGSGFYAGATNEALIGEIQKIAKEKPDVAQSLSALLGAVVNGSLGYSPVTGAAEAQYGTKWNFLFKWQKEELLKALSLASTPEERLAIEQYWNDIAAAQDYYLALRGWKGYEISNAQANAIVYIAKQSVERGEKHIPLQKSNQFFGETSFIREPLPSDMPVYRLGGGTSVYAYGSTGLYKDSSTPLGINFDANSLSLDLGKEGRAGTLSLYTDFTEALSNELKLSLATAKAEAKFAVDKEGLKSKVGAMAAGGVVNDQITLNVSDILVEIQGSYYRFGIGAYGELIVTPEKKEIFKAKASYIEGRGGGVTVTIRRQ